MNVKLLLLPAPQKFNTFTTFTTLDPVVASHRTEQSTGAKTAHRQGRTVIDTR
jgi:hypothetical protein